MRERIRTFFGGGRPIPKYFKYNFGDLWWEYPEDWQHWTTWQRIVDFAGKERVASGAWRGKYPSTPCEHYSVRHTWDGESPGAWFQNGYCPQQRVPVDASAPSRLIQYLSRSVDDVLPDLANEAFLDLSQQVPEEVSLGNFLIELREIGGLIPKLTGSLADDVAGGFLGYQFGHAPFIDDLSKLANLLSTVQARISWLKSTRGRPVPIGFTREGVWDLPAWPYEVRIPVTELAHDQVYYPYSYTSRFRAGGTLVHNLEGLDGLEGIIRGCFGALGFGNPLKVAWNAIPFSFIIDWFGRLSTALDRLSLQPFTGPWEIHNFTYSLTEESRWELWFEDHDRGWDGLPPALVSDVVVKRYIRGVGLPVTVGTLNLPLSGKQFALLAALAVSGRGR